MKEKIHPNYQRCTVTCISCGATFETGSTLKEIKVDTCSNCHPFYTGKQRFVQSDGRVAKFNRKYGLNEKKQLKYLLKNSTEMVDFFYKKSDHPSDNRKPTISTLFLDGD